MIEQKRKKSANHAKHTSNIKALREFERRTGFSRSYAVLGGFALYFILIFFNIGGIGQLFSNIAGFIIPGYYSLLALETTTTKDDTKLLTYWVVFAFLNVIEWWSSAILYWVPFYYLFKTVFLLYIGIPATGGANTVYQTLIKPFSQKYIVKNKFSKDVSDTAEGVSSSVQL